LFDLFAQRSLLQEIVKEKNHAHHQGQLEGEPVDLPQGNIDQQDDADRCDQRVQLEKVAKSAGNLQRFSPPEWWHGNIDLQLPNQSKAISISTSYRKKSKP
jgi:hypothetical protein